MDKSIIKSTTGWEFLDSLLHGGHRAGKTYGILSPTGGGRTTLATMIAAKGAECEFYKFQADPISTPGIWVLFTPGQASHHLAHLGMSLLRGLPLTFSGDVPNRQLPAPEDLELLGKQFETVGQHLVIPDDRLNLVANSGLTLVGRINNLMEVFAATGVRIAGVVIDDPKHILPPSHGDYRVLARNLRRLVFECQIALAERWNCPVWLTHPLATQHWTADWKAKFSAHDAADCSRFADRLEALFILGPHEKPSGRFQLHLAKGGPRSAEPLTMVFDKCGTFIRETVEGEFPSKPERKTREFEVFSESARRAILEFQAKQSALAAAKAIIPDAMTTETSETVQEHVTAVTPNDHLAAAQELSSVADDSLRELLLCS